MSTDTEAVFLLQQACGVRALYPSFREHGGRTLNTASYTIYHSKWFELFGTAVLCVQLMLCFFEPNSLFLPLQSRDVTFGPLWSSLCIETYCVAVHSFALMITYLALGTLGNRVTLSICCVVSFVSIVLTALCPAGTHIRGLLRCYRVLRPFYAFIYYDSAREWMSIIQRSFRKIWYKILIGTGSIICLFSIFCFSLYNPQALEEDPDLKAIADQMHRFRTFPSTMVHLFCFSLGLNNPAIWDPLYATEPWHSVLWDVMVLLLFGLFHNITLSLIIQDYERTRKEGDVSILEMFNVKLQETFAVISASNGGGGVPRGLLQRIFLQFNQQQCRPLCPGEFNILWRFASNNENGVTVLTMTDFTRFCGIWFSSYRLRPSGVSSILYPLFGYALFRGSRICVADVLCCVAITFQCSLYFTVLVSVTRSDVIPLIISGVLIFWVLELFGRLWFLGTVPYLRSRHLINGAMTVFMFSLKFVDVTHIDMVILRSLFLLVIVADIVPVVGKYVFSAAYALASLLWIIFVVMALQCAVALLGQEMFGNLLDYVREHDDAEAWNADFSGISDADKSINFRTFGGAYNTVMVIFGVNMFPDFMFWYQDQFEFAELSFLRRFGGAFIGAYFIGLVMFQYMFILNLVTAIFMDRFEWYMLQFWGSAKDQEARLAITGDLKESAKIVAPGEFIVTQNQTFGDLHCDITDELILGTT